ncbi:hypothetical protein RJ641_022263, partial [Dillenia turbinata]
MGKPQAIISKETLKERTASTAANCIELAPREKNTSDFVMAVHPGIRIFLSHQDHRIPMWWRWYYWIFPVAWTLCRMVVSQGDIKHKLDTGETAKEFVKSYFGYKLTSLE